MFTLSSIEGGVPLLSSLLPQEECGYSSTDRLDIRMIVCQHAYEALEAFQKGQMACFDAPAGDQACQIRAVEFCLLTPVKSLEQSKVQLKILQEKAALIKQKCGQLNVTNEAAIKKLRKEKLEPLSLLNGEINKEREAALLPIPKGDSRVKTIISAFAKRFAEVGKLKAPIEKEIKRLETECKEQQQKLLSDPFEMEIDPGLLSLSRAYLVNLAKVNRVTETSYQELMRVGQLQIQGSSVDGDLLCKMVEKAKKAICQDSITFVQKQAEFLVCEEALLLKRMVACPREIPKKGRVELSFFYLTRVIFQRALQAQLPILLKVRSVFAPPLKESSFVCRQLFKTEQGAYRAGTVSEQDLEMRIIVIEAISRKSREELISPAYLEALCTRERDLIQIIDLNTAQHTQYTDQEQCTEEMFDLIPRIETEEKEKIIRLFKQAKQEGFSLENPTQCCIDHVFCDLLRNQMKGD